MIVLLSMFSASAQEAGCSTIYSAAELDTVLEEADRLIQNADVDRALTVLRKTQDLMPCLDTLADRRQLAVYGRSMAIASFYQQDEVAATRWGRMAEQTAPDLGWGELPETHPLLEMLAEAGEPPLGGPTDKGLVVPKKGAIFMNGSFVDTPEARAEVPYLVQIFNGNGYPIDGYWQDGSAFPEALLGEPTELKMPSWYDPVSGKVDPRGKPPTPGKTKSDFPVPQVAIAGGLVVASGVLYALAGTQAAKVKCDPREKDGCPTTPAELASAQSAANWLSLGAGVALAGGIGVGVTGFVLDGGSPGLVVGGRFR
ncbi:MAG: hypothetical protein R3F61_29180 [Myxococcota bacterium]